MSCLQNPSSAEKPKFKNEYAVTFTFCGVETALAQSWAALNHIVNAVREAKIPELDHWTIHGQTSISGAIKNGPTASMADYKLVLTNNSIPLTDAAQSAKDIRVLYSIFHDGRVRSIIWQIGNLFQWKVGLANSTTAYENDVWVYKPGDCAKYRTATSAIGNLEAYLSQKRSSLVSAIPKDGIVMIGNLTKTTEKMAQETKEATRMMNARDADARHQLAVLYRTDLEIFAVVQRLLDYYTGRVEAKSGESVECTCPHKSFRDDASVDTLVGSYDEALGEKLGENMAAQAPVKKTRNVFGRMLADYRQKRSTKLRQAGEEKLALAKKKTEELHTALERLAGYYLNSANLHAHVMAEEHELAALMTAAVAECGWRNVKDVLRFLRGDQSGLLKGDTRCLAEARYEAIKDLRTMQGLYAEKSREIERLLGEASHLCSKARAAL